LLLHKRYKRIGLEKGRKREKTFGDKFLLHPGKEQLAFFCRVKKRGLGQIRKKKRSVQEKSECSKGVKMVGVESKGRRIG